MPRAGPCAAGGARLNSVKERPDSGIRPLCAEGSPSSPARLRSSVAGRSPILLPETRAMSAAPRAGVRLLGEMHRMHVSLDADSAIAFGDEGKECARAVLARSYMPPNGMETSVRACSEIHRMSPLEVGERRLYGIPLRTLSRNALQNCNRAQDAKSDRMPSSPTWSRQQSASARSTGFARYATPNPAA